MKYLGIFILCLTLFTACTVEPQDINYGKDACSYCKMNIVDQQHAAEIVTKKGKVYKYDAIECMLQDEENNAEESTAYFLAMDYENPNNFLDAKTATYLISENIPSPMGANLSAFSAAGRAENIMAERGGKTYSWTQIKEEF
jgi:copper chaperone NosL